jgi:hypothetical protein
MKLEAQLTDLTHDGQGWSANGCFGKRVELDLPDDLSDLTVSRRVKAALGIQGMRVDPWSGADWSWRDGAIGAWADVIE